MLVEIGDTPTPNGQKSNCLNDRSGKLNQLGTNPLSLSLLPLFFHPPPRRQKLQASDSFFLSLADCRRGGIRMEWPRLPGFAFPLFSLPPSRGTISRLTGARKNGLDNSGTESEKKRSVAFKRTVYPSVKTSGYRIVSFRIAASFGCHSVMRIEGRKRRGNVQSQ